MNAREFLKERMKSDFNTRYLVNRLDALYQEELIITLEAYHQAKLKLLNMPDVGKAQTFSERELLIAFFDDLKEQVGTYRIRDMDSERLADVFLSN